MKTLRVILGLLLLVLVATGVGCGDDTAGSSGGVSVSNKSSWN